MNRLISFVLGLLVPEPVIITNLPCKHQVLDMKLEQNSRVFQCRNCKKIVASR